ncbi:class I SAM-dependent methyltransferase [Oscillatoria sp. FACHB-1407]|uniref:class I SAM-dependent methyltransferase n=1 Tax=Oscillatoria sp. FACHB-1407 TaxID=2692847 RepID=UPI0016843867|nr:class I SAM-dependent methyltransferase [Oscillatoria sp. FACHB-1407]MBD2461874.1 class I SAM-dependent methyltransferase [Oscillatoria sp. FACHB-1407]
MDTISRFSTKAEKYIRYRWDYVPDAIATIVDRCQLTAESAVADVGSGTGMVSQHFVERVKQVFAIEPSDEMRAIAAEQLGHYPSFFNINGLSEATTLPDQSVDLIVVGRAIHWFQPTQTRQEFLRILKPGGWLAILQNPCTDQALLKVFKALRVEENGWAVKADKFERERVPLSFYYGHENVLRLAFPSFRDETWEEFLGRLSSLSPAPNEDHPLYQTFVSCVRSMFEQFCSGDRITVSFETELHLGQMQDSTQG